MSLTDGLAHKRLAGRTLLVKRHSNAGGLGLEAAANISVMILAVRCQKLPKGQQHGQESRRPQQEGLQGQGAGAGRRGCGWP